MLTPPLGMTPRPMLGQQLVVGDHVVLRDVSTVFGHAVVAPTSATPLSTSSPPPATHLVVHVTASTEKDISSCTKFHVSSQFG